MNMKFILIKLFIFFLVCAWKICNRNTKTNKLKLYKTQRVLLCLKRIFNCKKFKDISSFYKK